VLYLTEIAARYLADNQAATGGAAGQIDSWLLPALRLAENVPQAPPTM
jgi:hypothetical protein